MTDRAIAVEHDGQTVDVHHTCGFENCLVQGLMKMGLPLRDAWKLVLDEVQEYRIDDLDVVITLVDPSKSNVDTWCAWCGDFLSHGLECDCPDKHKEREPQAIGDLQR